MLIHAIYNCISIRGFKDKMFEILLINLIIIIIIIIIINIIIKEYLQFTMNTNMALSTVQTFIIIIV